MKHRKYLSIIVVLAMIFTVLFPTTVFAKGNGGGNGGGKGSSTVQHGKGRSSGDTAIGEDGGGTGEGEDGSGENEGSSGKGADKKGGVNRGGSGERGSGGSASKKGSSNKGGGSSSEGTVTLSVTVVWPENVNHPSEVKVTLNKYTEEDDGTVTVTSDTKTTVDGVATFISEPTGDKCELVGQEVPGFTAENVDGFTLTGDVKAVEKELVYEIADASVTVTLNKDELVLAEGYSETLTAAIEPVYAETKSTDWSSSNTDVAIVDGGVVTAVGSGEAVITVTVTDAEDNIVTDTCTVKVGSVESLTGPDPIGAYEGELVDLPQTIEANLDNGEVLELPAVWKICNETVGTTYQVPDNVPPPFLTVELTGSIAHSDLSVTLKIYIVDPEDWMPITVDPMTVSLYSGEYALPEDTVCTLTATVFPIFAESELTWTSSNESVATVTVPDPANQLAAAVTAHSPGTCVITVKIEEYGYYASCIVNVAEAVAPVLIYPCDIDGNQSTEFTERDDVFINFDNFVKGSEPVTYYVKVEQTGSSRSLGNGEITLTAGDEPFNLYAVTGFSETKNYSHEYFVSMSSNPQYPLNDELTAKTNFKIGTAVPSVPEDKIHVTLDITDGYRANDEEGVVFILARLLDNIDIEDLDWTDYLDTSNSSYHRILTDPYDYRGSYDENVLLGSFTDEVKRKGVAQADGTIDWIDQTDDPDLETLKLGGYVLLEVDPKGYIDNLNSVDPNGDGTTLLKEVNLTRNGEIYRYITNTFNPVLFNQDEQ